MTVINNTKEIINAYRVFLVIFRSPQFVLAIVNIFYQPLLQKKTGHLLMSLFLFYQS